MKTILASAPQTSSPLLKIVEPDKNEESAAVVSVNKEKAPVRPLAKSVNASDVPENWDESWFANYE